MAKLKLSPPWITFSNEVKALFKQDEKVEVVYDDEEKVLKLFVEGDRKFDALNKLLPTEKSFGNVTVKIQIVPANSDAEPTVFDDVKAAFEGNNAVSYVQDVDTPFGHMGYVVFAPEVVQFWNDDMSDIHGLKSTMYAEIARDVMAGDPHICYCTDAICGALGKPLGEWP